MTADAFQEDESGSAPASDSDDLGEKAQRSVNGTQAVELKDDTPVTVRAQADPETTYSKKLRLRGVALLGYENARNLRFSEETITAQVIDPETGNAVGEGSLLLKNQTPYPNVETMIYIALSEPAADLQPEGLKVRFSTDGLTRNGIFLQGEEPEDSKETAESADSAEAEESADSAESEKPEEKAAEDDESRGAVPAARLFYEKKTWNPLMPILYFLAEIAAGLCCLLIYGDRKLPFLRRGAKSPERHPDLSEQAAPADGSQKGRRLRVPKLKKLAVPALVLAICLFVMFFTYARVIRKAANASAADLLTGGESTEAFELTPGMAYRQIITASEDRFSGIGIRFPDEEGKILSSVKEASFADAVLEWKILDETGTAMLTSGSGTVKDLKKVTSVLGKDAVDEEILTAAGESFLLELEAPVNASKGKRFMLEIGVKEQAAGQEAVYLLATPDTNGQIQAAENGKEVFPQEFCLMGTYKCNDFFKGMFAKLCVVLLVFLTGLYFAARRLPHSGYDPSKQAALMYLVSALSMGMVFSFMTPAYTISDERTHIDTVYILSNQLLEIRDVPGPNRTLKRACDIDSSIKNTMPVTAARYRAVDKDLFRSASGQGGAEESKVPAGKTLTQVYARNAMANAYALCYLPAAIGFSAARIFGRNMITMIMAARWMNLLASVLIMYLAVRKMPYGAAAMAVIGLFPKTLQQMASCSYDGIIIGVIYLFIALCLTAAYDDNICIADLLLLLLTGFFAGSCKGGAYLPVLGMLFLIPAARAGTVFQKKNRVPWRNIIIVTIIGALVFFVGKNISLFASLLGSSSISATTQEGTKYLYTISDFIHSPGKLVSLYLNTFFIRADGILGELVGKNLSQKWYLVYSFIALALLAILHRGNRAEEEGELSPGKAGAMARTRRPGPAAKIWILVLIAVSVALISLSMLITFTARDMVFVDGLQGRYFLPLAPLVLLVIDNRLVRRDGIGDTAILYTADVLLALSFCEILMNYIGSI